MAIGYAAFAKIGARLHGAIDMDIDRRLWALDELAVSELERLDFETALAGFAEAA